MIWVKIIEWLRACLCACVCEKTFLETYLEQFMKWRSNREQLHFCLKFSQNFSFLSLNVCVYRPFTVHCLLSLSILWETSSFFFFVFPDKHSENVFFWFGLEPQVRVVAWLSGTERCSPVSDVRLRWDTDRHWDI